MKTLLFDPGHGGIIDGKYQTSGKRSPVWEDGRQLFEGEFNRAIVERLMILCKRREWPCTNLVPVNDDIPLRDRTDLANAIYKTNKTAVLISVHANAGGGTGFEVFTSPGQTKSDEYAESIILSLEKEFPELKLRDDESDGDHDKEARFHMLTKSHCPAVLIECAFMDTLNPDCELLMSEQGRDRFAHAIFNGIEKFMCE